MKFCEKTNTFLIRPQSYPSGRCLTSSLWNYDFYLYFLRNEILDKQLIRYVARLASENDKVIDVLKINDSVKAIINREKGERSEP